MALTGQQLATSDKRRQHLVKICKSLPEAEVEVAGDTHLAFRIRKRIFGYYLFDHHGDGKVALCCKSSLNEQKRLVREDAESFFVPAYLGSKGWIAVRLDLDEVDWEMITELLRRAYQEIAPPKTGRISGCDMIAIRHAELSDSEAIARVLYESFVEYESEYTVAAFAATVLDTDKVRERLEEGPGWIALADEEMVGTVCVVARAEGLYVRGMGVVPKARGLQIGELLLNEIENYAKANRFGKLFLSTTPFLDRAIRLYERFGFRFGEEGAGLLGTPLLAMEKELEWLTEVQDYFFSVRSPCSLGLRGES